MKIAAETLLPHQILAASKYDRNAAELQWRRMVEKLLKISNLKDSLAVCDRVTGRLAIDVSVALSLLVSEMSQGPWKGKLMEFSEFPNLRKIEGDNLRFKKYFIREEMMFHITTDFLKIFDKILQVAVDENLKEDEMIKRLYVFTDGKFIHASGKVTIYGMEPYGEVMYKVNGDWETDYREIHKRFRESGFSNVPEIVFWNLRHPVATVVKGGYKGVTLVSGMSYGLLKLFIEGDINDINPVAKMETLLGYGGSSEGDGEAPLEEAIPDMTSSTEFYVNLQKTYQVKAEEDFLAVEKKGTQISVDKNYREITVAAKKRISHILSKQKCCVEVNGCNLSACKIIPIEQLNVKKGHTAMAVSIPSWYADIVLLKMFNSPTLSEKYSTDED
ncbi:hypothetical protein MKW92_020932 [Papaver armeniacum]|nr:hypothetical protein MKW92_020932 [Papaver armeniacum]